LLPLVSASPVDVAFDLVVARLVVQAGTMDVTLDLVVARLVVQAGTMDVALDLGLFVPALLRHCSSF
jgi:hypothetical protein